MTTPPAARPPLRPSRAARWCLRVVTSAARAEAVIGDVVEDVTRRGHARGQLHVEAAVWRHVVAEAAERGPALVRSVRFVIRDAWRGVRSAPATTALGFGILTVGIAAATVTFSVVDGIVLRPLPYQDADRLARVELRFDQAQTVSASSALPVFVYERLRAESTAFTALAATRNPTVWLRTDAEPMPVIAGVTTATLFDVLAVRPIVGTSFTAAHEIAGADAVAVIGYDLWRRRFGADPSTVGRTLALIDRSVVILGVMPPGFSYPIDGDRRAEIWFPFVAPEDERSGVQLSRYLSVLGRLRAGVSVESAEAQANAIVAAIVPPGPSHIDGARAVVRTLPDALFRSVRPWMLLVLGAVALVMLIACANVANLLLSRSTRRMRELAIRTSMGASRRRITAVLLAESLMIALAAAALGLLIASWGVDAARAALPRGIARASSVALDFRVFIAAGAAAIITGLLAGLVPAWQASRRDVITALKDGSATMTTGRARWRTAFLVAQVAFVGLLLVATTLFVTSFIRVTTWDLGFERRQLLTATVTSLTAPVMDVLRAVKEVPGVVSAGAFANGSAPLVIAAGFGGGLSGTSIARPGHAVDANFGNVLFLRTAPGYFTAAGVAILRGRDFTSAELGGQDRVIVDARIARRLFPDGDAVGSILRWGGTDATIVGIAATVQDRGPDGEANLTIYVPASPKGTRYEFLIRTATESSHVIPAIQATLDRFRKPGVQPVAARPLEEAFRAITADRRFAAALMSIFGVLALFIGGAGIYGVMTSVVAQQTREFGIRVALGAQARTILTDVVMRAARHLAIGLAIGLPAGFLAARGVESILFGVKATDATIYVTVVAMTLVVGLLAAIVPARRAARVDPLMSLRSE